MIDFAAGGVELGRGVIAGAFVAAIAYLAGYAAIRRSPIAAAALFLVVAAAALELGRLGFFNTMPAKVGVLLQGIFAASVIVFLSSTIRAARRNALLGGAMFTGALVLGGMGVINLMDRVDLAPLMQWGVIGVGVFGVGLAAVQAVRGDNAARLILPGALIAMSAPLFGALAGVESAAFALAPHGLFTLGVLAASLVALTENFRLQDSGAMAPVGQSPTGQSPVGQSSSYFEVADPVADTSANERRRVVIDSQIARVLDYSGVAIWDWSEDAIDQTPSLPSILGADRSAPFTPDAMRKFIHKDDTARFEQEVLKGEGAFDVALKLFDGRKIRMRGAKAMDDTAGALERVVAFVEAASPHAPADTVRNKANGVKQSDVRKATQAAIVPAVIKPDAKSLKLVEAIEQGDIVAAFQPIVDLETNKIAGYEALARWRDQKGGADEGPEIFVKTAEAAGKGGALATIMLEAAGAFLAEKIKREKHSNLFVALNLSYSQMRDKIVANAVRDVIVRHKLPAQSLVLELTEGEAVRDTASAGAVFKTLKQAGAALAFDDFGAGFSCLSNLQKYDFDYLKIDQSFAADLENGKDGAKIVRSLASLGEDLGLKVIVEGLETKAAVKAAHEIGCAYGQGYALGKPKQSTHASSAMRGERSKIKPHTDENNNADTDNADPDNVDIDEDNRSGRRRLWRKGLR